jgi:hypothetical protein
VGSTNFFLKRLFLNLRSNTSVTLTAAPYAPDITSISSSFYGDVGTTKVIPISHHCTKTTNNKVFFAAQQVSISSPTATLFAKNVPSGAILKSFSVTITENNLLPSAKKFLFVNSKGGNNLVNTTFNQFF